MKSDTVKDNDGFSAEEVLEKLKEVQGHGFGNILIEVKDGVVRQVGVTKTYKRIKKTKRDN